MKHTKFQQGGFSSLLFYTGRPTKCYKGLQPLADDDGIEFL